MILQEEEQVNVDMAIDEVVEEQEGGEADTVTDLTIIIIIIIIIIITPMEMTMSPPQTNIKEKLQI
jgi:hypothetical protein